MIDAAIAQEARGLGVDMSRAAEVAIAEAVRTECDRRWRGALVAYAREIERAGPSLARFRSF